MKMKEYNTRSQITWYVSLKRDWQAAKTTFSKYRKNYFEKVLME
jgi:hypothetical protein